jgi:tagatose-1,6-bisphosphate aldolase non-catalytic subunit AgaZ/GatZ
MVKQEISIKTIINGTTVKDETKSITVWPRKIVIVPQPTEDGLGLADAQISYTTGDGLVLQASLSEVAGMGFEAEQADTALRSLFDALLHKHLAPEIGQ